MQFHISYKQAAGSLNVEDYARRKLTEKIQKYVKNPVDVQLTFSFEGHEHLLHMRLRSGGGFNTEVEYKDPHLQACIDRVAEKLEAQLKRRKDKNTDYKVKKLSKYFPKRVKKKAVGVNAVDEEIDAGDILKFEKALKEKVSVSP